MYEMGQQISKVCSILQKQRGEIEKLKAMNQNLRREKEVIALKINEYLKELEEIREYVRSYSKFTEKKI